MIIVKQDILSTPLGYLVHGCNAQGVMGAGLAKQIAKKWPGVAHQFRAYTMSEPDPLGKFVLNTVPRDGLPDLTIVNLVTQMFYGRKTGVKYASLEAIETGLRSFVSSIIPTPFNPMVLKRIAIPKIGCGLGGLDWSTEVLPVLRKIEQDFWNVEFYVYVVD